jgi:hypothetical protein
MKLSARRPVLNLAPFTVLLAALVGLTPTGQVHAQPPPTANPDNAATMAPTPVTINVLSNDMPGYWLIDPTSVQIVTPPAQGSTSINPSTGAITYTPGSTTPCTVTFQYAVRDTHGIPSYPASVQVNVMYTPPTAGDDSAMTAYNSSAAISVLANDTGGTAAIAPGTVEIVTQPTRGTVSVNPTTGVVTYQPTGTAAGSDSFQYRVSDMNGHKSNTATVNVSVSNMPPQIVDFLSSYQGSDIVRFQGRVIDEDPASCTVHLGKDLNFDMTPQPDGTFVYLQELEPEEGQVTAKATDTAGQQSEVIEIWYFTHY